MNPAPWRARSTWTGMWMVLVALLVPAGAAAGTQSHTLSHAGVERSFRVDVPDGAPTHGAPLLVALHGGGGNGASMVRHSGLSGPAGRAGFVVAYPDGSGRRPGARLLTWNAGGGCCGVAADRNVDDVGFLRALIADVQTRHGTDPRRVYITGMSNGAMMAWRMACQAADVEAAIAPVAGALHVPCKPSRPVAVLAIHGTADANVPYAGGSGTRRADRKREPDPPLLDTLAAMARHNRCTGPPRRVSLAGGAVLHDVWPGCVAPVALYTVVDGGHAWPGGERMSRLLDAPSPALDASARIVEFMRALPPSPPPDP